MRHFVETLNRVATLIYFLFYGVLGWIIDTGYRTVEAGFYAPGTWIPFFSLVYPVGAFLVIKLNDEFHLGDKPLWLRFVLFAFFCTIVEYIGGLLSIQFLHQRLWDYSNYDLNIHRLIEPWHTVAWGALAMVTVQSIHPRLLRLYERFLSTRTRPRARKLT